MYCRRAKAQLKNIIYKLFKNSEQQNVINKQIHRRSDKLFEICNKALWKQTGFLKLLYALYFKR